MPALMANPSLSTPTLPRPGQRRAWWRLPASTSALALALVQAARGHRGLILAVCPDSQSAHALENDLRIFAGNIFAGDIFAGDLPVLHFPDWETLPYDLFSPHPDIISQRIATLSRLPACRHGILVVPVATLMQRLPPVAFVAGQTFDWQVGDRLDLSQERRRLDGAGYRLVQQVGDPGDFAIRGALLDVFPMGADTPYRIELFDDSIESIRCFDPESQRSEGTRTVISMLPAREFPTDEAALLAARERLREQFAIDPRRCSIYLDLKAGVAPGGIEYYLPLFFDTPTVSLFDYLDADALAVIAEPTLAAAETVWQQIGERYQQRRHDIDRPVLAPDALYLSPNHLREQLNRLSRIEPCSEGHPRYNEADPLGFAPAPRLPLAAKGEPAGALKAFLASYPGRVLLAADSPGRREALSELLDADGIRPDPIADWQQFGPGLAGSAAETAGLPRWAITVAPLEDGFALIEPPLCLLTERQLYPERASHGRRTRRVGREPEAIIRDLTEIAEGAPIVHEAHGVGRYRGLVVLDAGGQPGEYLEIEYARGDKLYVPVAQLHLVNRYTGADPEHAPLHSLGGEAWSKAKRKAAEKVRDVAAELLEIQAKRQARKGLALPVDRAVYESFAAGFPFEETPDQLAAIEGVIADLGRETPMDRLGCGDVGFGKTEVAVRAAFVAAMAGKQVAVLVPTTLLAQQHYRNFRDRFADWPIRIESLSRLRSPSEIKDSLGQLADGRLDVIVGTHRLLQSDVAFRDLGLVIVDEEQRFGVRQKERLKALRAEVHLLTLTATPIPRTLNMTMAGLRELSLIATPPAHRLAVKTFLSTWDDALIREACLRELGRGGQIYFLHNDVASIKQMARELGQLVPEARIGIGHGQMPERELEQVMLDFQRQRFNLLLCSTIIESGIDIPNANTILINRADRFGLAQLHQLRGRVGRSHHRAYAYLLVPETRAMTADARKRLDAIAAMEELGAGFTLATHDLEIRGAGELLGEGQSGQIAEIGFGLYSEYLERTVRALKAGRLPDLDLTAPVGADVRLHVAALIPDDYLPDVHTRLTFYKRIASARDEAELRELQVEMIDRFGLLPEPARNLFATAELKLRADRLGIRLLDLGDSGGRLRFDAKPAIDPRALIRLIQGQPQHYRMDGPDTLRIRLDLTDGKARLDAARGLLIALAESG